jgi:hypothetical protein
MNPESQYEAAEYGEEPVWFDGQPTRPAVRIRPGRQLALRMAQRESPYSREFEQRHHLARQPPFIWQTRGGQAPIPDIAYGVGTEPSHYYPGWTPKDVVLSQQIRAFPGSSLDESRFFGMLVNLMTQPRVLSNDDLLRFLNSMRPTPRPSLSEESNQLLTDLEHFIQTVTDVLQQKNADEKLQRFVFHAIYASEFTTGTNLAGLDRLRSIWHVLFAPQFRQLVFAIAKLVQNAVGGPVGMTAAQTTIPSMQATQPGVFPEATQPAQAPVATPAAGGSYRYFGGQEGEPLQYRGNIGPEPIMADGGGPELASRMGFESHQRVVPENQGVEQQTPLAAPEPVRATVVEGWNPEPSAMPARAAEPQQQFQQQFQPAPQMEAKMQQPQMMQVPLMQQSQAAPMQPSMMQGIQQQSGGSQGMDFASRLRQPLPDPYLFQIMEEFREVLRSLSGSEEYAELLNLVVQTITELGAVTGYEEGVGMGGERRFPVSFHSPALLLRYEENRRAMLNDLKSIIEAFAGGYSLNPLIAMVDQLQLIYNAEWRWRDLLAEFGGFIQRAMRHPRYMESDDFIFKGADLVGRLRQMLGTQHPGIVNGVLSEAFSLINAFRQDGLTTDLYSSLRAVITDLALDPETGGFQLKPGLLKDFRNEMIPAIMSSLRFIPLPRIEVSTDQFDVILDNVILSGPQIIPSLIEFRVENELQLSPRPELPDAYFLNVVHLAVYQVQVNIRNVEFAIRKKKFPTFEDVGLANIVLAGNGLSLVTRTAVDPNLPYTTLVPMVIEATIDQLNLEILESHHKTLGRLFGKSLVAAIKKRLCLALESQVYQAIRRLDAIVTRGMKGSPGGIQRMGGKGMALW